MDPNFVHPIMASYFANRSRTPGHGEDQTLDSVVSPSLRRSLTSKVRHASGAVLISLGERLSGAPRLTYSEPADETARITS